MPLPTESYQDQARIWPADGRHILAQFEDESIIPYQAYAPSIGHFAAANGVLGGPFRYTRMSWVKPNFLWMMFRSGWGTKPNQEVTLALRVRQTFFDALLGEAVPSTWNHDLHPTREAWSQEDERSHVRLQWDPDHDPSGAKLERRAIQLGLRGPVLKAFGQRELLEVQDISDFVAEQRHARRQRAADTPRARLPPSRSRHRDARPARRRSVAGRGPEGAAPGGRPSAPNATPVARAIRPRPSLPD